jgi:hypothetical protein
MSYDELPDSSGHRGRATTVAAVALVVVGSVLWSSSSSASSGISASPSTPQLEALASSGVSASSPSTPQLEALVDDIDYSYSYWEDAVSLLDDSSGSIYVDTEYAQCYTGFCTLNGDGLTASRGGVRWRARFDVLLSGCVFGGFVVVWSWSDPPIRSDPPARHTRRRPSPGELRLPLAPPV